MNKDKDLIREAEKVFGINRNSFIFDLDFWAEITYELLNSNEKLTRDEILFYIRKYKDKLDWECLSENFIFTEKELEEFINVIKWEYKGSKFQVLSEEFIKNHWDILNHDDISTYQILSEDFIFEYFNELNTSTIISFQILSEDLIDRLNNDYSKRFKIDWFDVSKYVIFSSAGLKQYKNYLDTELVFRYQPFINDEIVELYLNKYPANDLNKRREILLQLYKNIFYIQRKRFKNKDWFVCYFYFCNKNNTIINSSSDGYIPVNIRDYVYIDHLIKGRAYYSDLLRTDWIEKVEVIDEKWEINKLNIYKRI